MHPRDLFEKAHSRARWNDFIARLGGRSNDLLPFQALSEILQTYQQIPHREPQVIPLDRIVGSVGRYRDFTRDFLPRNTDLEARWTQVERAMSSMEGVPPIEVFQVGDVYFVADGNHRVSVAHANGFKDIEAYVTEIPVDADLQPGDSLDQAIIKAGRARFLAQTQLGEHLDGVDIHFTKPGGYTRLLKHIQAHQGLINRAQDGARPVTFEDAAVDWYFHIYQPIVTAIRDRQLLRRFPDRTAADLYIWIWAAIEELYGVYGERVSPDEGAALLELRAPTAFQRAVSDLMDRLGEISRAIVGGPETAPDWADQVLEWGDYTDAQETSQPDS